MSSIPSSAMPHAGPSAETEQAEGPTLVQRATDLVRENPRTAIAAGAAVAAGVAAAAAIPLVRGRRSSSGGGSGKSGGGKKKGG
ncbi:MAG: hypothetical protein E6G92_00295 [Alphaproteobacteria bacterium]|nr:MAG: hypothetical protein E6G92_00295 [Alphaproteobacteria bacterium]